MRRRFIATATALLVVLTVAAEAADSVWTGLVMASNAPEPTPIPAELDRYEGTLKQLFGYNQYQIIGQARNSLGDDDATWRASSKYFALEVNSKPANKSGYVLNLQLYQQDKRLLELPEVKLGKKPLFVRGPQVGDGQLVLVLALE